MTDDQPGSPHDQTTPGSVAGERSERWRESVAPLAVLTGFVLLSLWPVSLLGRHPSGGDIDSLHFPSMAYYGQALNQGRVPIWNERADFGIPILAEGQIGVFYPPHLVAYRLLDERTAFSACLVLHLLLAAWFAYFAARGLGLESWPACLTGLIFVGQGFFVVQLTNPWSYTTACWLPLAVLATFRWIRDAEIRWLFALTPILALQLLAGHFQIACYTYIMLLIVAATICASERSGRMARVKRACLLPVPMIAALCLAAIQLVPTIELFAGIDPRGRGAEFASSFMTSPYHLVNLLAPTLMQQDPLWEPIAWIPYRTTATSTLLYFGLLPLGLACWATRIVWRQPLVRVAAVAFAISVVLSLGSNLPGGAWLLELPGLRWFSAPSRWTVFSGLFLGLLAGTGLQHTDVRNFHRWCSRFLIASAAILMVAAMSINVAVRYAERFEQVPDEFLRRKLERHGYRSLDLALRKIRPATELNRMTRNGLVLPGINIILLGVVAWGWKASSSGARRGHLVGLILVWTVVDLGVVGQLLRRVEFCNGDVAAQHKPVLDALTGRAPVRVAGGLGRLPSIAGVTAISKPALPDMSQYWNYGELGTADIWSDSIPTVWAPSRWGDMAVKLHIFANDIDADDLEFIRLTNIRLLVCGPDAPSPGPDSPLIRVWADDPAVPMWTIWATPSNIVGSRAWQFPVTNPPLPGTDPRLSRRLPPAQHRMLAKATPASVASDDGESLRVSGEIHQPTVLLLADLMYHGWTATLVQDGRSKPVPIESAFGGFRAVQIPQAGSYEVEFIFDPLAYRVGREITLGAIVLWITVAFAWFAIHGRAAKS